LQLFEVLFLVVFAVGIARLVFGPVHTRLSYAAVGFAGLGVLLPGAFVEGLRWQMLPAYLGFTLLMLASLKKTETRALWRRLGAFPLFVLLGGSAFLIQQVPVLSLPAPSGPYGVGTFSYSITDPSRKERYAPDRNREVFVEVWYPADKSGLDEVPVRTLFQELYEGRYTRQSFLFGYMKHIPTHSHVRARIAANGGARFPVLLFNHAMAPGFTSQNQLLMEQLASNGYVVVSIAHPYQSSKVNLAQAGTITEASAVPQDLLAALTRPELHQSAIGKIMAANPDVKRVSAFKAVVSPLAERYFALPAGDRKAFLRQAVARKDLQPFRQFISEDLLEDYFIHDYLVDNSLTQYWVEDARFVADRLGELKAPVAGFHEAIDASGFGAIGMSYGGGATGELCKIDPRCRAAVNLDGTQFGRHWDRPMPVPFLMFYNEEHQGGNDFAYLPATHEFWEYTVDGAGHFDFTDFTYAWPLFKTAGMAGSIDGMRMTEITNGVVLNFFDHTLKGKPVSGELFTNVPEISVRHHAITPQAVTASGSVVRANAPD
jgi:predicted dienelactone hydrolase